MKNKISEIAMKRQFDDVLLKIIDWAGDDDSRIRSGIAIEWLASSLSRYLATVTRGDTKALDVMLTGTFAYMTEDASAMAVHVRDAVRAAEAARTGDRRVG